MGKKEETEEDKEDKEDLVEKHKLSKEDIAKGKGKATTKGDPEIHFG